ncbi:MAG TPA: helix-turn-helix domain-containing protein [Solirubrobacter sp.]|nr:helix-turn-helix domain-containing protein [Solirubrobacter sp.]
MPYHAPGRVAAAERTRRSILAAALASFESAGWAGTTIAAVASDAGVSPKTVEAHFRTKAGLLEETVTYAVGAAEPAEAQAFKEAPDALAAIAAHAAYVTPISARSAGIAWAVEAAAPLDARVAEIAERLRRNRAFGARWAARVLIAKRGVVASAEEAERVVRFAIDPAVFRTLTRELGLDLDGVRAWTERYERGMLLLRA